MVAGPTSQEHAPSAACPCRRQIGRGWTGMVGSLTLLAASTQLKALELIVNDLQLGAEYRPLVSELTVKDDSLLGGWEATSELEPGLSIGTGFDLVWSLAGPGRGHGFLLGGELHGAYTEYAASEGVAATSFQATLRGLGGYGILLGRDTGLHLLGFGGYGWSQLDVEGGTVLGDISGSGALFEYGGRAALTYALSRRWTVRLHVGWQQGHAEFETDSYDIMLDQSGFVGGLTLGFCLDPTPIPLE